MADGTRQAFPARVFFPLLALLLLVMTTMMDAPQANAQTPEGTVRIIPAISSVALEDGPFTVFVVLEDLEHVGVISYDDDRDTVPDREMESIGLAAFEFTIQYDPTVLAVAQVERGPSLDRSGRTFQCLPPRDDTGSFSFGCLSMGPEPPGPQGTLTLASVTFLPVGPGASFLVLETELAGPLGSDEVPVEVNGGAVRVTGRPVATATAPLPGGETPAPGTRPAGGLTNTPLPVNTTVPPTSPLAPENGETPRARTATIAPENGESPAAPTTPAAGDGGRPQELTVRQRDIEAEEGRSSAADGPSSRSVALWSAVGLGSLAAAASLGLAAIRWRRRGHRPGE